MITEKSAEDESINICKICDFKCSKRSNYEKHLLTRKHINNNLSSFCDDKKMPKIFRCECGKEYKHRQGLHTHKKICDSGTNEVPITNVPITNVPITNVPITNVPITNVPITTDTQFINIILKENMDFKHLILEVVKNNSELFKQNQEYQKQTNDLQKQVLEVCQKIQPSTIINTNNSHNKTFNLQFFLNEQCKDAMNIMDFVNTFQLQFSDLERIGEVGYVEGISNIVINKLNEMDVYKRPIHCSDAKREIMYVKDKDVWEKDNANNDKLRLALKHITKKNTDLIRPWAVAHPGVLNSDHRLSDKYQEMIIEAMGGNSGTMKECEAKIIKKISKMVLIDKSM
jgi:hypothetical protein